MAHVIFRHAPRGKPPVETGPNTVTIQFSKALDRFQCSARVLARL
jgi:hypothetical protein